MIMFSAELWGRSMSSTSRCVAAWRRQGKQNSDSSREVPCLAQGTCFWACLRKRREDKSCLKPRSICCRCCLFHCVAETRRLLTYSPHRPLVCFMCLLIHLNSINILPRFTDIYRPSYAIPTWRLLQDTLRFYVLLQCWKSRKRSRRSARWPLDVFDKNSHQVSPFCIPELASETRNKSGQVPQAQEQVFSLEVNKTDVVKVSRFRHWDSGFVGEDLSG